jgi:hypothetical protein
MGRTSAAARSVLVFGLYLLVVGALLLLVPDAVLKVLGLRRTHEPWIRILGTVTCYVGIYYLVAARHEMTAFFRASIGVRLSLIVVLLALVLWANAKPILLIFGGIEAAGALWTRAALVGRRGTRWRASRGVHA